MGKSERRPPQQHIRVFLSSPGDVAEERELARRLIKDELPRDPVFRGRVTFEVASWDDPASPSPMPAGLTPQEAVNYFELRPSECDIVLVVLWSRLGTHLDLEAFRKLDGKPYLSGTEWEFEDAWNVDPRPDILVYRRTEEPRIGVKDPARAEKFRQWDLVEQFFAGFTNHDGSLRAGWTGYDTAEAFKERLASDLRHLLWKRLAGHIAAEKGVPIAPLRAVLARLGEREEVLEHEIPARLARWADEFAATRERLERRSNDWPEAGAARHRAAELLSASNLDGAQAVLAEARRSLRESREQTAREEAAILADEARVHRLRLEYVAAADALQEAAKLVASFDPVQAWRHTLDVGGALTRWGYEFGDNAALVRAIQVYREALTLAPRAGRPEDWARTQHHLADALLRLGEREAGAARLEEAAAAFRAALRERTRGRAPLDWAATQASLGEALRLLGQREAGAARLEEAAAAFRAALRERTRDRAPLDWAATQNNLGAALLALGQREAGTARLEEAAAAFRAALEERTRGRVPLEWAWTQADLGAALTALGEREAGTARLEAAVEVLRAALEEYTRGRVPLEWAWTQNNLGEALLALGQREAGTARLEEAAAAFRAVLEERTRGRVPLDWAWTQSNLGAALLALGQREAGTARLEEAVVAFRAALEEGTRKRAPLQWAKTQNNLGNALQVLGQREAGAARLEEAVAAFDACLTVTMGVWPPEWVGGVRAIRDETRAEIEQRRAVERRGIPTPIGAARS